MNSLEILNFAEAFPGGRDEPMGGFAALRHFSLRTIDSDDAGDVVSLSHLLPLDDLF